VKVLIIDDEEKIRKIIKMYFCREGYEVVEAANGLEALDKIARESFDLALLDIMLPGADGFTVCKKIREKSSLPIIMLTAREEESDRVLGLELGADDYVVKPFSPRELVARARAVLRRTGGAVREQVDDQAIVYQELEINQATREVKVGGQSLRLTVKEFNLLWLMAGNPGRAFTREDLLQRVWGYDYSGDTRTVDTHINRLREKLSAIPGSPGMIKTVWGVGYKFEVGK
jgi:two-component system response regulator ResD